VKTRRLFCALCLLWGSILASLVILPVIS